jgi:hypothetical protein
VFDRTGIVGHRVLQGVRSRWGVVN